MTIIYIIGVILSFGLWRMCAAIAREKKLLIPELLHENVNTYAGAVAGAFLMFLLFVFQLVCLIRSW